MPQLPIETIRKNGKILGYRVRIQIENQTITGPRRASKSSARSAFAERSENLNAKPDPSLPTFSISARRLLDGRLKQEWQKKTLQLGEIVLVKIDGHLGALPVEAIGPAEIIAERVRWGLSASTSHRYQRIVERLLKLLGRSVKAEKPRLREPSIRILTRDEQTDLLNRAVQPRTRLAMLILLRWGLRNGEACGLKHEDRFEDGVLLRRAIREDGKPYAMKTDESRAWLPLYDPELAAAIGRGKGYVLATASGTPMLPSNLRRMVQSVAEHTSYEGITPQELRHTAAVNMLRAGNDVGAVAQITRHSVETLLKIYDRVNPEAKRNVMKRTAEYLRSA